MKDKVSFCIQNAAVLAREQDWKLFCWPVYKTMQAGSRVTQSIWILLLKPNCTICTTTIIFLKAKLDPKVSKPELRLFTELQRGLSKADFIWNVYLPPWLVVSHDYRSDCRLLWGSWSLRKCNVKCLTMCYLQMDRSCVMQATSSSGQSLKGVHPQTRSYKLLDKNAWVQSDSYIAFIS